MAATYLPNKLSLVSAVQHAYPHLTFVPDAQFRWEPSSQTIYYNLEAFAKEGHSDFFHELGHALLDHLTYDYDIALVRMEAEAWEEGIELAQQFNVTVDEAYAQEALRTYQEWLAGRSTCPNCTATGLQVRKSAYQCINCRRSWRVNSAKFCALRRYQVA